MRNMSVSRLNSDESSYVGRQCPPMNPADEREAIQQKKRKQLIERMEGTSHNEAENTAEPVDTPTQPIYIQHLDEFNDVVERYPTVLVDFYAEWCGPCKQLDPIVRELASELSIMVAKVDIDAHQPLAQQHNVRGADARVVRGGKPVEHLVRMQSKATLRTLCEQYT